MVNGESSYHRFLMGDKVALTEMVDMYYDGLVYYLYTYLHNLQDAEDAAEDTLLVLVTKRPQFKGQSSFKTWLYAIGRKVAWKRMRKEQRTVPVSPEIADVFVQQKTDPENEFCDLEEKKTLYACLGRIQQSYYEVLWLKYYEDLSAKEIADILGKSLHSVNHLITRAKQALRKEMEKEGYGEE